MKRTWMCILASLFFLTLAVANDTATPGFIVIAPDRGYEGNEEIRQAYQGFQKGFESVLVFISLSADDEETVRTRLKEGVTLLRNKGAGEVVVLPMLLSDGDPHLRKAKALLGEVPNLRIAPAMGDHYLLAQILEERARELSQAPAKERFLVVGAGATSHEEAQEIRSVLDRLIAEVKHSMPFQETHSVVLYNSAGPEKVVREGNQKAQESLKSLAADKNLRTIVVPFHLGYKHTASMQTARTLEKMLKDLPVRLSEKEILPHSNVALWLRRRANQFVPPRREEMGIVVMIHGAGEYMNEALTAFVTPLSQRYNVEVAFGMADVETLQKAVETVEARGARRILIFRLYNLSLNLRDEMEYLVGQSQPPEVHHGHGHSLPRRLTSGAILYTAGGHDSDPLISQVFLERTLEVSQDPQRETVILLAHGEGDDSKNNYWLEQLTVQANFIQERAPKKFKAVVGATVREDWPDKREAAVAKVRSLIAEGSRDGGRVLVISARFVGAGSYRRMLDGLPYTLNAKGLAGHPNVTQWIEKQIEKWIEQTLRAEVTN